MRPQRWCLGLFALLALIFGMEISFYPDEPSPYDLAGTLIAMGLIFGWYYYDAKRLAFRRPQWLNVLVVVIALVGIPVYLIKSRPRGKRLRAVGLSALTLVCYTLLVFVGLIATDAVRNLI